MLFRSQPNFDQTLLSVFDALNDRPIVYHKIYAKITGSILAGLLLAQLIYWSKAMKHKEFYKTNAELCEELGMSIDELKAAKKKIIQLGLFSIVVRGIPPTTYYTINLEVLFSLISKNADSPTPINKWKSHQLGDGKSTSQVVENPPNISEMTTEITKEDNNNKTKSAGCSMAVTKKKSHVEPKPVVVPEPQPEPKAEPTTEAKDPIGSVVVVDTEISDLARMVKAWAISRIMLEIWAKKHGVDYVLQKIELTKSAIGLNRVKKPGA